MDRSNIRQIKDSVFKQLVMPPMGTILEDRYKVSYVNLGKMRFTAFTLPDVKYPEIDETIMWKGRIFNVSYINKKKKRFSAVFKRFAERPDKKNEEVANLI